MTTRTKSAKQQKRSRGNVAIGPPTKPCEGLPWKNEYLHTLEEGACLDSLTYSFILI